MEVVYFDSAGEQGQQGNLRANRRTNCNDLENVGVVSEEFVALVKQNAPAHIVLII